jgi:hypothetical protein
LGHSLSVGFVEVPLEENEELRAAPFQPA